MPMKLLRLGLATVILLSGLFILGCSGDSHPCDFGTFDGVTYTNSYFNLKIDVPESWYVMDDEDKKALFMEDAEEAMNVIADAMFEDSAQKSVYVAEAMKKLEAEDWRWGNLYLLNTSEYGPGMALEYNPSLIISAHELAEFAHKWSGREVANSCKQFMETPGSGVTCPKEVYEEVIGGVVFGVLEINYHNDDEGTRVTARRYSTVKNKYELRIELIYAYDEQDSLQELEAILATMRLQP